MLPPQIPPPPNQQRFERCLHSFKPNATNYLKNNVKSVCLGLQGEAKGLQKIHSQPSQLRIHRSSNNEQRNSNISSGYESSLSYSNSQGSSFCVGRKNVRDEARRSIHSTSSSSDSSAWSNSDGGLSDRIYLPPSQTGMSADDVLNRMLAESFPDDEILAEWLNHVGFEQYLHLFVAAGYDLRTVARMTPEDLTAIGVTKPMHRKQITADIHRLNILDYWSLTDETNSMADWLCQLRLPEYTQIFLDEGYEHVGQVTKLTWEDFEDFGIRKLGHLKKLEIAINKAREKSMIRKIHNQNDSLSIIYPAAERQQTFHNCPGNTDRIRNPENEKVLMNRGRTMQCSQFPTSKNKKNSNGIECSGTFPRRNPTFSGHPLLILPNQSNNQKNPNEDLTYEEKGELSMTPTYFTTEKLRIFHSPPLCGVQKWRPEPPIRSVSSKNATRKLLRTPKSKPSSGRKVGKRVSPPTLYSHFQQYPQETAAMFGGNGPHLSGLESALNLSLDSCYRSSPSASIDCIPPPPPAAVIRCEETIRNLCSWVDSRRQNAGLDSMRLRNSYSSESLTSVLLNCEGFNALNSSLTTTPGSTSVNLKSLIGPNAADPSSLLLSMRNKLRKTRGRSSSTETLPFANENCGTIKSACHRDNNNEHQSSSSKRPSTTESDDINFCEANTNSADNDNRSSSSVSTIVTNSSTSTSPGGGSPSSEWTNIAEELQQSTNDWCGSLNQLSPSSLLPLKKIYTGTKGGPEVLNDIGNMLQNLTDELDSMLILPSSPSNQN